MHYTLSLILLPYSYIYTVAYTRTHMWSKTTAKAAWDYSVKMMNWSHFSSVAMLATVCIVGIKMIANGPIAAPQ